MARARPKQHKRKLPSGKVIVVNKGVKPHTVRRRDLNPSRYEALFYARDHDWGKKARLKGRKIVNLQEMTRRGPRKTSVIATIQNIRRFEEAQDDFDEEYNEEN